MQLPSWLTLSRRARRNRRRLPLVPAIESLEDRTLLSLLWAYDSGTGHLEFTTDDDATTIVVQVSDGVVGVAGWGETVSAELVNTMSIATGGGRRDRPFERHRTHVPVLLQRARQPGHHHRQRPRHDHRQWLR